MGIDVDSIVKVTYRQYSISDLAAAVSYGVGVVGETERRLRLRLVTERGELLERP